MDNSSTTLNRIEDYNSQRVIKEKYADLIVEQGEEPAMVAAKVLNVVESDKPQFRNLVGKALSVLITLQHIAYGILEKTIPTQLNKD